MVTNAIRNLVTEKDGVVVGGALEEKINEGGGSMVIWSGEKE